MLNIIFFLLNSCALAEMFTDGHPPFDLSQLLAYRNGDYDPTPLIDTIDDEGIKVCIITSNKIVKIIFF